MDVQIFVSQHTLDVFVPKNVTAVVLVLSLVKTVLQTAYLGVEVKKGHKNGAQILD